VKFASVASDGVGVSGRRMLEAMIAGRSDAKQLADLVPRQLRSQIPQLEEALYGRISEYHRWMLRLLRDQLLASEQFLARLDERIAELTRLSSPSWRNWMRFPIDRRVAEVLVAEVGPDMSPFPERRAIDLLGGLVSGQGRECRQEAQREDDQGERWLRQALVQAAWAASHKKDSYFPSPRPQPDAAQRPQKGAWWPSPTGCSWSSITSCSEAATTATWGATSWTPYVLTISFVFLSNACDSSALL